MNMPEAVRSGSSKCRPAPDHGRYAYIDLAPPRCCRTHIDKSGWWLLLGLIPFIGSLVILNFLVQRGTESNNRFG